MRSAVSSNPPEPAVVTTRLRRVAAWGRHHSTGILAALFLLAWWSLTLRQELPILLALTVTLAAIWWMLRHRRDIAGAVVIAAATTAAPVCAAFALLDHDPNALEPATVLFAYTAIGNTPTLTAWMLVPPPASRTRTALVGSTVLLVAAAASAWLGGPAAAALLPVSATVVCAGTWRYHQRRHTIPNATDLGGGWVDLGPRRLPTGSTIDHLALGHGYGIAACSGDRKRPRNAQLVETVVRAAAAADVIGLPVSRMQPVLLTNDLDVSPTRQLVNTGDVAAAVTIAHPRHLTLIATTAPRRLARTKRNLRRAAAMPSPPAKGT